ncbi:MAG: hypothetical protein CVU00_04045 [Bacteroidetes bacterium HGW-Bacteroidetes-17]|nr:MAG: hypothetical protein CVU00_04045 [Bacteroidetes bacterium HGW-Bacteroidetes-17]
MFKILQFFISLILLYSPIILSSQNNSTQEIDIKGRIIEADTKESIPFAHIFFEGTLNGTTSDINGYFVLKLTDVSNKPLIVSSVGYKTKTLTNYSSNSEITISLEKNIYMLADIEILADNLPTKRKLRMFKAYFLGTSNNAAETEIMNPEVLNFFYDKSTNTLNASATEPIMINNSALGYRIIYYLENFKASEDNVEYTGNYYFEELPVDNADKREKNLIRRFQTYKGSRLHLIRSIWNNSLKQDGFTLFYTNYKKIKLNEVITDLPTGEKIICLSPGAIIYYGDMNQSTTYFGDMNQSTTYYGDARPSEKSYLMQQEDCTKIDKDGYYDPKTVKWSGQMSEKRVADLLPYEYLPYKK